MATSTNKYNLTKPDLSEKVKVEVLNANMDVIDSAMNDLQNQTTANKIKADANALNLSDHINNTNNPHGMTKGQIGLENVENKSSATIRGELTKNNVTNALGYTPYTPNEIDNKLSALETNIDWKEAVATFDDIFITYPNPQDGWTVNVNDTDITYRFNGEEWIPISANAIPKATDSVDGLLSKEDHLKYEDAYSKKHTHNNKSVLDGITAALITAWNSAAEHITDTVKHITSSERTAWNVAKTHADSTHARTDATKVEKSDTNGNIKINGAETSVYTHLVTSGNKHIPSGGSAGQILKWSADGTAEWNDNIDMTDSLTNTSSNIAASAKAVKTLNDRVSALETGGGSGSDLTLYGTMSGQDAINNNSTVYTTVDTGHYTPPDSGMLKQSLTRFLGGGFSIKNSIIAGTLFSGVSFYRDNISEQHFFYNCIFKGCTFPTTSDGNDDFINCIFLDCKGYIHNLYNCCVRHTNSSLTAGLSIEKMITSNVYYDTNASELSCLNAYDSDFVATGGSSQILYTNMLKQCNVYGLHLIKSINGSGGVTFQQCDIFCPQGELWGSFVSCDISAKNIRQTAEAYLAESSIIRLTYGWKYTKLSSASMVFEQCLILASSSASKPAASLMNRCITNW